MTDLRTALEQIQATATAALAADQPTPPPVPDPQPGPPPAELDPMADGLLDRQGNYILDGVDGVVIEGPWSKLQPSPNSYDFDWLDKLLAEAKAKGRFTTLRPLVGVDAPKWLLDKGCMPLADSMPTGSPVNYRLGLWTTDDWLANYDALQQALAAHLDGRVDVVQMGVGTQVDPEVLLLFRGQRAANAAAYAKAGFTEDDRWDALCQGLSIHADRWKRTRTAIALNPAQRLELSGSTDMEHTLWFIGQCVSILGARCVLQNHSLRARKTGGLTPDDQGPDYLAMYQAMTKAWRGQDGVNISIQTAQMSRIGDLPTTVSKAVALGACQVELPAGYKTVVTADQLATWGKQLAANAR